MDTRNHLRASDLDKIISIRKKVITKSPQGAAKTTYAWVAQRIHANVQDMLPSRGEAVPDGIQIARRPARIRTRYRTDISSDMEVIVHSQGDRAMKIMTMPAELGRKDGLEFVAEEFTTAGTGI